ncbi:acetylhydrolase [Actinoplanes sp. TRM 88003]|uniref:Acetylhydrolase n=1 Tax=Paractinoplanes aksuensis TaxID=2939490 RepID=A0ABT1DI89_9ACTN|nr:acetylhydrolase [Actinoplanes aksuensis]MCO8270542.1 acetylhydrolase [Actinoplanes aksuensis]
MTTALSRRHLLTAALAAGAALPMADPAWASRVRLTLPKPTGPHAVGNVELHLVGGGRDLMATVWYPAGRGGGRVAAWMPDAPWRALVDAVGFDAGAVAAPLTAARDGAPVLKGRRPVVLYSHGNDTCRSETTIVVQELVSHGYVVATVDHTGDGYTLFPDGRVGLPDADLFNPWDSAHDMRVLLDKLEVLAAGRNPDAERRPLPVGLGAALDLSRVGMFGWSKGATSTALVMNTDRRVRAGIAFDGEMQSQPPVAGLSRPFMVMSAAFPRDVEPSVEEFWQLLRGWRLNVHAVGAAHGSYNDQQWLVPQIARISGLSDEELLDWCGTLDPARAVRIQQAYPLAFFDLHLRGRRQRLMEGPSRAFPEVRYLP